MDAFETACNADDRGAVLASLPAAVAETFATMHGYEAFTRIITAACTNGRVQSVCGILEGVQHLTSFMSDLKCMLKAAAEAKQVGVLEALESHQGALKPPRQDFLQVHTQFGNIDLLERLISRVPLVVSPPKDRAVSDWQLQDQLATNPDEITDKQLERAAETATNYGNHHVLRTLLGTGLISADAQQHCLFRACYEGHLQVLQVLMSSAPRVQVLVKDSPSCPAEYTPGAQAVDDTSTLVPSGITACAKLDHAFSCACVNGSSDIVEYLLSRPLSQAPSRAALAGDASGFQYASGSNSPDVVRVLLQAAFGPGRPITPEHCTRAFKEALESGSCEVMGVFLDHRHQCGINFSACFGSLQDCIKRGHMDAIYTLYSRGDEVWGGRPLPLRNAADGNLGPLLSTGAYHLFLFLLRLEAAPKLHLPQCRPLHQWSVYSLMDPPSKPPRWASDPALAPIWALQGDELLLAALHALPDAMAQLEWDDLKAGVDRESLLQQKRSASVQQLRTWVVRSIPHIIEDTKVLLLRAVRQWEGYSPHLLLEVPQGALDRSMRFAARWLRYDHGLEHMRELAQHWDAAPDVVLSGWLLHACKSGKLPAVRFVLSLPHAAAITHDDIRRTLSGSLFMQAADLQYCPSERQGSMLDCACELLWGGWRRDRTPPLPETDVGDLTLRAIHNLHASMQLQHNSDDDEGYATGDDDEREVPIGGGLHLLLAAAGGTWGATPQRTQRWERLRHAVLPMLRTPEEDLGGGEPQEGDMWTGGGVLGEVRWVGFDGCPRVPRRKMVLRRHQLRLDV